MNFGQKYNDKPFLGEKNYRIAECAFYRLSNLIGKKLFNLVNASRRVLLFSDY